MDRPEPQLRPLFDATPIDGLSDRVGGQTVLADAAATLGDHRRAARFYANLLPWAHRFPAFMAMEGSSSVRTSAYCSYLGPV